MLSLEDTIESFRSTGIPVTFTPAKYEEGVELGEQKISLEIIISRNGGSQNMQNFKLNLDANQMSHQIGSLFD